MSTEIPETKATAPDSLSLTYHILLEEAAREISSFTHDSSSLGTSDHNYRKVYLLYQDLLQDGKSRIDKETAPFVFGVLLKEFLSSSLPDLNLILAPVDIDFRNNINPPPINIIIQRFPKKNIPSPLLFISSTTTEQQPSNHLHTPQIHLTGEETYGNNLYQILRAFKRSKNTEAFIDNLVPQYSLITMRKVYDRLTNLRTYDEIANNKREQMKEYIENRFPIEIG